MWIAIGLIGALWVAGMWVWPDKNAPPQSNAPAAQSVASSAAAPRSNAR